MDYTAAVEYLQRSDALFHVEKRELNGVFYKVMPNIPKSLLELLEYAEPKLINKTYIVSGSERITYESFLHLINKTANSLVGTFGLSKGDKVAIAMKNCPEYLICLMGIIKAGGIAVLLNAWWTTEELEYGFRNSGAKIAFTDEERSQRIKIFQEKLEINLILVGLDKKINTLFINFPDFISGENSKASNTLPSVGDVDEFAIMYSSGSTSYPKGVVLTHIGALNATFSWKMFTEISKLMENESNKVAKFDPAILCATPLFHVTASHPTFFLSLALGAKLVLMHKWDPKKALKLINYEKITRFLGVPTMTSDLTIANQRLKMTLPSLSFLGSGGAKRPANQVQEQSTAFPQASLASGWGMTETNALGLGSIGKEYLNKPHSTGRLYPPIQEMKIIDRYGTEVSTGVAGELCVKSIANMKGYHNNKEDTDKILNKGWLRTGDKAAVDKDGFVTIIGRFKEIIIRGGENISCLEIEEILYNYPKIIEVSIFAVPQNRYGEEVGALIFIDPKTQFVLTDFIQFLCENLAKFKHPKHIWITTDPLPKGTTDKIDKKHIKKLCIESKTFRRLL